MNNNIKRGKTAYNQVIRRLYLIYLPCNSLLSSLELHSANTA